MREFITIVETAMTPEQLYAEYDQKYPIAGHEVDGRFVMDDIPNTSSISASLQDYEELPKLREVPLSEFGPLTFANVREKERVKELAEKIAYYGEIAPVIVVIDAEGPYILEGVHRIAALQALNAKSVPALVIIEYD